MELYEIKEKVGSDPCLVLDFDFDGVFNSSTGIAEFTSKIKSFNTITEAQAYINDFVKTIEELVKTRCVEFLCKLETDDPNLTLLDKSSLATSNIFFGVDANPNIERAMQFALPAAFTPTNIKILTFGTGTTSNSDNTYSAAIIGYVSLT